VTVELGELELDLYSVHLESRDPPTRRLQTLRLAEDLQERAGPLALAVGDFNALPMRAEVRSGFDDNPWADCRGDDCLARFSEQLPGWREVWEDRAEQGGYTFPAMAPNRKLDHQWAAPGLGVVRAEVLDLGPGSPSDHRPLLVDYSLP
jgi:endonuclease/exonuclease/phosphatase family metal-dependent hydrolase